MRTVLPHGGARFRSFGATHAGLVRAANEDAFLADDRRGLWAVSDGMGGHARGDFASATVVEGLRLVRFGWRDARALAQDVLSRLEEANARLRREAGGGVIGATVVALAAFDGHGLLLWCGDSRLYRFRRGEGLIRLTHDHTVVEAMVRDGRLAPEDAETHPQAHVLTRAVGAADDLALDWVQLALEPGDRLLLCSDGLTRPCSEPEIAAALAGGGVDEAARRLVDAALRAGAPDNIAVVVLDVL